MSDFNLYAASNQWSTRPADQRFWTLADMHAACQAHRDSAREATVQTHSLTLRTAGSDGADLELVGKAGTPARLTHWAFGQLSRVAGAPADYLRSLPADLAATNLNHGLARHTGDSRLLLHRNGSLVLRSITSDSYTRIWNCNAIERLLSFESAGWRVPPARPSSNDDPRARPATEADVLADREGGGGLSVNVGDMIAPAGLYASDHDCFVFMVNESRRIADGTAGGLSRGFFLTNSEVGNGRALTVTTFLYRFCCGNHIVWGASNVSKIKIVHRGEANARFNQQLHCELTRYADARASETEGQILAARKMSLGDNKDAVLDTLFKHLRGDVSQKTIESGYDRACLDADNDRTIDPRTVWGMVQGLTAHSQTLPFADERAKIDRAAGKVLEMAF